MWIVAWIACTSSPPGRSTPPDETGSAASPTETPPGDTSAPPIEPRLVFTGPRPTNLLVISLDTTRRDALGRYRDGPSATPFLDGLLEQSVVLDDHRSCSNWTGPSMLCATSGSHPVDVGAMRGADAADRLPTIARVLGAQAGFTSSLVTANPFFFAERDALGFDEIHAFSGTVEGRAENVAEQLLEEIGELEELEGRPPWYAHAHFFDPHDPYCPPEDELAGIEELPPIPYDLCEDHFEAVIDLGANGTPDDRARLKAHVQFRYQAELRYWDRTLSELFGALEERGSLDDTLVVFWTDHGEQFLERGSVGHSLELFAEETRAAAAFWARNLEPAAVTAPTAHQDLAATIYELFGTAPERPITGLYLDEVPADRALGLVQVAFVASSTVAVVTRGHQLTLGYDDRRFFHDLTTDPEMLDGVYDASDPDVVAAWEAMEPLLDRIEETFPDWFPHDRVP